MIDKASIQLLPNGITVSGTSMMVQSFYIVKPFFHQFVFNLNIYFYYRRLLCFHFGTVFSSKVIVGLLLLWYFAYNM